MRLRSRLLTTCFRSAAKLGAFGPKRSQLRLVRPRLQLLEDRITPAFSNGVNIVTYRMAIASTAEFTKLNGGITGTAKVIDDAVDQLNVIFGRELSVQFVLVPNNDSLIFTDPDTDGYTSGDRGMMLGQNQTKIDSVITSGKYDIGHVFDGADIGGQAVTGVGISADKAKGVSGSAIAGVDANFLHTISHEIGHQFGAGHTFNAKSENKVLQDEYHAGSAYEPGTGSTLMSYARFDDGVNNYATSYSSFFHTKSLDQMTNWINNTIPTVGTKQASNNLVPFVNANPDYTIPANTPFLLTGTGNDPVDTLHYTWEQYDLGPRAVLGDPDTGSGPLFRTFEPTPSGNVRSFPALETVLAGKTGSDTEVAATTSRALNFRLTGRDMKGAYFSDATVITTVDTGSGFAITNFNTGTSVYAGTKQTVNWDIAGTTGNGINVSFVVIDLSTDGGKTFTNIASSVPNDGSHEVTLPTDAVTNLARFRIRGTTNIFYDINNANFSIKAVPTIITVYSPFSGTNVNGSLGQAILESNEAPGHQTINFDPAVFNTPEQVSFGQEMPISDAVTINGPGWGLLTIRGNNAHRIFNTDPAPAGASIKISGLTLTLGQAADGGAIYVGNESLAIQDCVINNSSASEDGGAINIQNAGSLTLVRSTISGNTAADDGGGIYFNNGGSFYLIDSALVNNTAVNGNGGGLYFFGTVGAGGFSILTSTIANNSSAVGGGGIVLPNFSGTLNVVNSTVTGNYTFDIGGGGIARTGISSGSITLSGSIVSGNTGPSFAPDILSSGTVYSQYSAIGSTAGFTLSGTNNLIGQNLKLRPLAYNGGPSPTVAFEFDSPLRGKGVGGIFTTDQRGLSRDSNGVDIGAFELQTTVTNTNNGGLGSLRDAVVESNRVVGTDIINFGSLFNTVQTINLQTGEIALSDAVTIQGNGEGLTRISGLGISRIFNTTGVAAGMAVTLRGLTLTAGKAGSGDGGAIISEDEYLVVEDSVISNSTVTAGVGGAIRIGGAGKLTLNRSSLIGNSAFGGGAIRFVNGGNSEIIDSSIIGNTGAVGGAIFLNGQGSSLTIINSTLSGNSASNVGGGIAMQTFIGALTIRNSTITGNTSKTGGGVYSSLGGTPNIHVESTIVSGNTAGNAPDIFCDDATLTVNKSAIGSAAGFTLTGANNLPFGADLKLGALANNGGSTLTHLPANDSPLINAGSNPASLGTDQRGVVRTLFGATDIGSVEVATDSFAPTISSITSATPNGSYGPGASIDIVINFSEPVTLLGTLNVTFNNGGVGAITAQQPGMVTLTGTYTVAAMQSTPDLNVTGLTLTSGSTLRDASDNNAVLSLPANNFGVNKDIVITTPDVSAPSITSITSPTPNGTYGAGATIGVALNFSEPVTLSGFLFVFLDSGGSLLIPGPQTGQSLNGIYTVGFNQNTPDLNVTTVQLDIGSSLRDGAMNNADLALPVSNLANNSNIVISTPATPTFTVTNTNDSGAGSLRQAVIDANNTTGFQNIVFDSSFNSAKTITLSGEISILDGVSITGPGANLLTINGNNAGRVFNIASGSAVTISGVGITGGQASQGGGIFIGANRPALTLVDVRLFNNSATNQGGGIWIGDSTNFTITRSTLSGNTSGTGGGGLYAQFSNSTITDSAIINNVSNFGSGGGFFAYGGVTVTNSTISGNSAAALGAGIATGSISIRNSTIVNNTGVGIARTFGNGTIAIESSIVSGNTSQDISSGGTVNVNFSAIGSNAGFTLTGSNNLPFGTDLKLGALANNGGSTLTHALTTSSPAINKGSNTAGLSNDQRGPGFVRVSGGAADIGAYEYFFSPLVVLNANDSGDNSLRGAIAFANSNPGPDTITFDAAFFSTPQTIILGGTQMAFTDTIGATTVTGPGISFVTVTGNNFSRVFIVNSGVTVSLTGMTIAGGNATDGAGFSNSGTLTIDNSRFTGNKSSDGGAILNVGTLTVSNSTFDSNTANTGNGFGGAITSYGNMNVSASTFIDNQSSVLGGAIVANGTATISDSTFTNNSSSIGGALRFHGTVTVTGSTLGGNSATDGGGIANYGILNVNNSKLNNNTAVNGGGAISNYGDLTFGNNTVTNNTAVAGGGMLLTGSVAINDSQFSSNEADYGGAIKNDATVTLSNSTFDQNSAVTGDGYGGAIWNNAPLTITGTTFTNNNSKTLGGAINSFQGLNISNSTFSNNTSALNGGALRLVGTTDITGSTFSGNAAANDGGAIMSHGATTITNSTLASNTASIGGGIYFFEGSGTLRNVTVAYNAATNASGNFGGGTHVGTANVTAVNTIVAGNTAAIQPNAGGAPFTAASSNNLLNLSAADAGLAGLNSYGGPTQTIALFPGSPAINGGNSVGVPTTDQRGLPRVGATDIGAFEVQVFQPAKVAQFVINEGAVQRSRVTSMEVTFNHPVTFATTPAAAFQLQRQSDGKFPNLSASLNNTRDVVTLTFLAGDAVDFGSLADGKYTLTINAAGFASDGFDGDGNGIGGDNYVEVGSPATNKLFRLFGDADGNGSVSAADFNAFRLVYGTMGSSIFDFSGDGQVSAADFNEFRLRYGVTFAP